MQKALFKKFTVSFLILVFTTSFVLSGCKKKAPEKPESYDGIELTYYKVFDDKDVITPVIEQFEADHPGLTINYRQFDDFKEYQNVILNEMAEGEGPDIFSMQNTWFMSNYKKIYPMPEQLGTPALFQQIFVDTAYKDLVRPDSSGLEQIYGLPMTVDTLALYYNKAHFEDRVPDRGRPSTTWEGIKEDIDLLKKEDNSFERFEVAGIALGRADNIDRAVDILYLLFLQYGVKFYDENISEVTFAGKSSDTVAYPALEALDLFTSFADEDQKHYTWNEFIVDDDSVDKEVEAFAKGKVSMIVGYSYTYDQLVNQIGIWRDKGIDVMDKDDIGIAPIPQIYDPDVSTDKRVTYASYFAETVSRNTEYPDLAWDFLVTLTMKENLEGYFEETHKPTSRRDMIKDQKKHPIYGVFADQIGYAESFPILDYYLYREMFTEAINKANEKNAQNADLLQVQNRIEQMLPKGGLVPPKKNPEELENPDDGED